MTTLFDQRNDVVAILDQRPEAVFALDERLLRALLLGNVPDDDRAANGLALTILNRRGRDADREHGAIFTHVLCFKGWKGLAIHDRGYVPRRVLAPFRWGQIHSRVAQHLLGGITDRKSTRLN